MKNSSRTLGKSLVVLASAIIACDGSTTSDSSVPRAERSRYDGEAIFRGLFFGSGAVADLFPEIWDNPTIRSYKESGQFLPETQWKAVGEIIEKLAREDPEFLVRFENDIQSGDQVRIEKAFKDTAQHLNGMVSSSAFNGAGEGIYSAVTVIVNIVLYRYTSDPSVVVTVDNTIFIVVLGPTADGKPDPSLRHDLWIDLVARRLGPESTSADEQRP